MGYKDMRFGLTYSPKKQDSTEFKLFILYNEQFLSLKLQNR